MAYSFKESSTFPGSLTNLNPGDVILCTGKSKKKFDPIGDNVQSVTESNYVHAALYLGEDNIVEAVTGHGVQKKNLKSFLEKYNHCVVLRRSEAWTPERVNMLSIFVNKLILNGAKYNLSGALKLGKTLTSDEAIKRKIDLLLKIFPGNDDSKDMFCSQLVAMCFIITGYIGDSAKEYFNPTETAPIKLAHDRAYGDFLGYIWIKKLYQVPDDDELYHYM